MRLFNSIDRSTLLIKDSDSKPIIMLIEGNRLELKIDSEIGSMQESMEIKKEGKDIRIGFNPKFIMDVLKSVDDEIVSIYFINPKAPCYIRNDNRDYLYIVLPVNISE
jgi:DNA polymerase-3 subunit beta